MSSLTDEDFEYSFGSLFITLPKATYSLGRWTEQHNSQGFSLAPGIIQISTLTQFGSANLTVYVQQYEKQERFERVIEMPFEVPTTQIEIGSIERVRDPVIVGVEPGHYRVVVAQSLLGEDEIGAGREEIEIFLEKVDVPLCKSRILVCDAALNPPEVLLET